MELRLWVILHLILPEGKHNEYPANTTQAFSKWLHSDMFSSQTNCILVKRNEVAQSVNIIIKENKLNCELCETQVRLIPLRQQLQEALTSRYPNGIILQC